MRSWWIVLGLAGCLRGSGVLDDDTTPPDEPCDGDVTETAGWWYADADGDGYGDIEEPRCPNTAGAVPNGTDCNDANADAYPGQTVQCIGGTPDADCDPSTPDPMARVGEALFDDLQSALLAADSNTPVEFCDGSWAVDPTVITSSVTLTSASGDRSEVTLSGTGAHLFEIRAKDVALTLQGVTLKGGQGTMGGVVQAIAIGAEEVKLLGTVTLRDVVATDNTAAHGGVAAARTVFVEGSLLTKNRATATESNSTALGGAIFADAITISDSDFIENHADLGGAAMATDVASSGSTYAENSATFAGAIHAANTVTSTDDRFEANTARFAGAVEILGTSSFIETDFVENESDIGGALVMDTTLRSGLDLTLSSCSFEGNQAAVMGGAAYLVGSVAVDATGTTFLDNVAGGKPDVGMGGAVKFTTRGATSTVTWTGGTFTGNTANSEGGAFHMTCEGYRGEATFTALEVHDGSADLGGGAFLNPDCHGVFAESEFTGNEAERGGVVFLTSGSTARVASSTLTGQNATLGAVVFLQPGAALDLIFATVTSNTASDDDSGAIHLSNVTDSEYTEIEIWNSDLGLDATDNWKYDVVKGPADPSLSGHDWSRRRGATSHLFCNSASCLDLP